jgi:Glycosyl transferase family 2
VLSQDYPSIELVVVDDGSTASTARALDEVTAQDRRVVVVRHQQSLGSAAARNAGLAQARGELVAFCDDDDVWLPGAASAAVDAPVGHAVDERAIDPLRCRAPLRRGGCPELRSRPRHSGGLGPVAEVRRHRAHDPCAHCSLSVRPAWRGACQRGPAGDEGHRRLLDKHRSSMSSACIAHHELTIALMTRDRKAGKGQIAALLAHPSRVAPASLLAGEFLASRVGRRRGDPGLPLRFAVRAITRTSGRPRSRRAVTRLRRTSTGSGIQGPR